MTLANTSHLELNLDAYGPGMHLLTLTASDGATLHREKVVRQ
jgi:hypothetical protein